MCGEQIFEEFQMLINILLIRVIECLDIVQETNMRMERVSSGLVECYTL